MLDTSHAVCTKSKIARQFSRAAVTYDSAAEVQIDIAHDALALMPKNAQNILDIGCGTGRNSCDLANRCDSLIALDLAYGMLAYAREHHVSPKINWLQGDAENLPLQDTSVEGVFSSMVLQWCSQPQQVMSEIHRVLKKGGNGVLAIMCEGSLVELNESWLRIDQTKHVNDFASAKPWIRAAGSLGLEVTCTERKYLTWHRNVRQLLTSIKSIGANLVLPTADNEHSQRRPLNRFTLQNLETVYRENYSANEQLPLTYQVCYIQIKKT